MIIVVLSANMPASQSWRYYTASVRGVGEEGGCGDDRTRRVFQKDLQDPSSTSLSLQNNNHLTPITSCEAASAVGPQTLQRLHLLVFTLASMARCWFWTMAVL